LLTFFLAATSGWQRLEKLVAPRLARVPILKLRRSGRIRHGMFSPLWNCGVSPRLSDRYRKRRSQDAAGAHTKNLRRLISSGVSELGIVHVSTRCLMDELARCGFALRFQLALCSQPILKVTTRGASPLHEEFISAVLNLFGISYGFAEVTLLVLMFVMFHVLCR